MKHPRLTRRTLLRGAAGISIALPFLEAMRPGIGRAQGAGPKRFGVFFMPDGVNPSTWEPKGDGTNFTFGSSMTSLEPHREDLVILRGVNFETSYRTTDAKANPHDLGMAHMLTASQMIVRAKGRADHVTNGTAGGPSIDQAIAQAIGGETKLRSLELGVESTTSKLEPMVLHMSYGGPDDARTPIDEPKQAFTRLFGDTDASQSEVEILLDQRRSVLDAVLNDFKNVNAVVGYDDKQRLERHASHIRDIENQVANLSPVAGICASPTEPTVSAELVDCVVNEHSSTPMNAKCLASFTDVGKAQMDLMVLAFACDLSRVVSLQWSTAEGTTFYGFLPGITGEHHRMSHDTATYGSQLTQVDTWYAEQFAYLLSEMKKIPEGEGNLLDNSLMYWVNEQEDGQAHNRRNVPLVVAGKAGGMLTGGRVIRYQNEPHNKLYTTFLNMFGVEATEFGEDFAGSLTGLV
jgi:hypothetical protein